MCWVSCYYHHLSILWFSLPFSSLSLFLSPFSLSVLPLYFLSLCPSSLFLYFRSFLSLRLSSLFFLSLLSFCFSPSFLFLITLSPSWIEFQSLTITIILYVCPFNGHVLTSSSSTSVSEASTISRAVSSRHFACRSKSREAWHFLKENWGIRELL